MKLAPLTLRLVTARKDLEGGYRAALPSSVSDETISELVKHTMRRTAYEIGLEDDLKVGAANEARKRRWARSPG